jgi:glycosyltransferase involved in cell wall biosynthesis
LINKICRLVWDYPLAGEATYGLQPVFTNLSEEQAKQGYEVHVLTTRTKGQPKDEYVRGVNIHRLGQPFNLGILSYLRRLTDSGRGWVVHSHATCGFILFALKPIRRFPLVSHAHGTSRSHHTPLKIETGEIKVDYSSLSVNYHATRERLLWGSADRVLAVSKVSGQDIVEAYHVSDDKVRVVYNGVDSDLFRPISNPRTPDEIKALEGKRILLYVGHFGMRKGLFFLINAMKKVKDEFSDAHLVCIGGVPSWLGKYDYYALLKRLAELNGVSSNVTFLKAVRHRELVNFYNKAEISVLPSYYETFSKVCTEAMSCEVPLVASRSGGLPEIIEHGKTGLLVRYGDSRGLASAIIDLMSDEKRRRATGRSSRERVLKFFTWKAVAERISSVYSELDN